jgi:hypothetical protein
MHLSEYLNFLRSEGNNFWISQREGRAKDGIDQTNPAIINMFFLSERKKEGGFAKYIKGAILCLQPYPMRKTPVTGSRHGSYTGRIKMAPILKGKMRT